MTREELKNLAEYNGLTLEEAIDQILACIKAPFATACFEMERAKKNLREAMKE